MLCQLWQLLPSPEIIVSSIPMHAFMGMVGESNPVQILTIGLIGLFAVLWTILLVGLAYGVSRDAAKST